MKRLCVLLTVLAFAFAQMESASAALTTLFVATNATGDGSGSSWANATNSIQGAISAIDPSNPTNTVWVSNGVYEVGGVTNWPDGTVLTNRVAITNAITVRSANNDPTNTIIKGYWDTGDAAHGLGAAAVRCVYMTNGSSLIGFMVTNGATFGNNYPVTNYNHYGGGVWCPLTGTRPVISNCVIAGNSAKQYAGGVNYGSLFNCTLNNNYSGWNGGGANQSILSNCTLSYNVAYIYGGGTHYGTLYNCTLVTNKASQGGGTYGGTMYHCTVISNIGTSLAGGAYAGNGINCILIGNSSLGSGGASYNVNIYNCTIVSNSATGSGGGACGGTMYNSISWDNNKEDYNTTARNSCGVGYTNGGSVSGNITNNPQFVNSAGNNYRLSANSPCINTGTNGSWTTNSYDLDGRTRIRYGTVDMGAYELIYDGTIYTAH